LPRPIFSFRRFRGKVHTKIDGNTALLSPGVRIPAHPPGLFLLPGGRVFDHSFVSQSRFSST
jgi:hypothetical protein